MTQINQVYTTGNKTPASAGASTAFTSTAFTAGGLSLDQALAAVPFAESERARLRLREIILAHLVVMVAPEAPTAHAASVRLAADLESAAFMSGEYGAALRAVIALSGRRTGRPAQKTLEPLISKMRDAA